MKKRITALLLCLVMVFSLIPTSVWATESPAPPTKDTPDFSTVNVQVKCSADSTHEGAYNLTEGDYHNTGGYYLDPLYGGEYRYVVELVKSSFITKLGESHTEKNDDPVTAQWWWSTVSKEWIPASKTVEIECTCDGKGGEIVPGDVPAAPTDADFVKTYVRVNCETDGSVTDLALTRNSTKGVQFTTDGVVSDGNGGYTYTVTINKQPFIDRFAEQKVNGQPRGTHAEVAGSTDNTITWRWNEETSEWVCETQDVEGAIPGTKVRINVKCVKEPTKVTDLKPVMVMVECEDNVHPRNFFGIYDAICTVNGMEKRNGEYFFSATIKNPESFLGGYNKVAENGGMRKHVLVSHSDLTITWKWVDGEWVCQNDVLAKGGVDSPADAVVGLTVKCVYNVTFDSKGGTTVPAQEVERNATATKPADDPTKEDCKFLGWFDKDGHGFDFSTPITEDITLTAKWQEKQTVQLVIYRNGNTTTPYDTVKLDKQFPGTTIDLTTLNIADYYSNSTGKYDFYGWYNDGKWNQFTKNPDNAPAGLEKITVNGWTNLKCMVYDYENVVYFQSKEAYDAYQADHSKTDGLLLKTTARKGSALPTVDAPKATRPGYTFQHWSREGQSSDVTGQTVNGWTNLYGVWEITPHNIYAYAHVNSYFAPLTAAEFDDPITLNDATLSRLGLGSYNRLGYIPVGTFNFAGMPLTADMYTAYDEDPEMFAVADATIDAIDERTIDLDTGVSSETAALIDWTVLYKTFNEEDMAPGYITDDGESYQLSGNLNLATVMFNAGKGVDPKDVKGMPEGNYVYDDVVEIYDFYFPGNVFEMPADPTREGYIFKGWSVEVLGDVEVMSDPTTDAGAEGEKLLKAGDKYSITAQGVKFTAEWEKADYTIASDLRLNGNETVKETGKTYAWTHRYGGKFEETIDYTEMLDTLEAKAMEVDAANEPYSVDIMLRFPGQNPANDKPGEEVKAFNDVILTYGQKGGGWNPGVKNTAYIWGYATTSYQVIFDSNGGSDVETQVVMYGEKAENKVPTMKGYNFVGWFIKGTDDLFDFNTEITHKTELEAHWAIKVYNICSDLRINGNKPHRDDGVGYDWTHRYGDEYGKTIIYKGMFDTLEAKAMEVDAANEPYDAKIKLCFAGKNPDNTDEGGLFNEKILTYGQDGANWQENNNNTVYMWGYATTRYEVSFDSDGGSAVAAQIIDYKGMVTEPKDPEKYGYNFTGWVDKDGNAFDFSTEITHKTVLTATWEKKNYTVSALLYLNDNTSYSTDDRGVAISRTVTGPFEDSIDYATLKDLLKQAALAADAANKPNKDYADVVICLNDGSKKVFDAETYGQTGYNWRDMGTANVAYTWAYVRTYYDVTFVDGSASTTQVVKCGDKVKVSESDPTKEGYRFLGWYTEDGEKFDFDTPITKSMTLTAKWEIVNVNAYIIPVTSDGTMLVGDNFDMALAASTLNRVGLPGYEDEDAMRILFATFASSAGLADADDYFNTEDGVDPFVAKAVADLKSGLERRFAAGVVEAKADGIMNKTDWRYLHVGELDDEDDANFLSGNLVFYSARFVTEGENVTGMPDANYTHNAVAIYDYYLDGETITIPDAVPERYGYDFLGWSVKANDEPLKAGDTVTVDGGDVVFTAQWKLKEYNVIFDSKGGTKVDPQVVEHGSTADKPKNPRKNDYTFKGWYLDGKKFDFSTPITGDITLVAKWTTKTTGGSNSSNDTTTKGNDKTVKSVKTFDGGIALYVGLSVLSATGSALVITKKKRG